MNSDCEYGLYDSFNSYGEPIEFFDTLREAKYYALEYADCMGVPLTSLYIRKEPTAYFECLKRYEVDSMGKWRCVHIKQG